MKRHDRKVSMVGWLGALTVGLLAVAWFAAPAGAATTTGAEGLLTPPVSPHTVAVIEAVPALHTATATTPAAGTVGPPASTSFTAANRFGAATGPGDCLGPNCSQFNLTVGIPGTNNVRVRLDWMFVTNDYDLYIFQCSGGVTCPTETLVASSGNGTTTFEEAIFTPTAGATYHVVIVHFAAAPGDNITGVVSLIPPPTVTNPFRIGPNGTGIAFSPNGNIMTPSGESPSGKGTTYAPETVRDGEPSVRVDKIGDMYPAGIRGVPAGVDVWRFRPTAYCPRFTFHDDSEFPVAGTDPPASPSNPQAGYVYLGQPDGIFVTDGEGSPDAGGGDIELAVSFPATASLTNPPTLSMVSLTLANITSAASADRGNNWTPANPVAATVPLDDRQWIEAYGQSTVYLYYRTLATLTGLVLNKSIDGGVTYATSTNIVNPLGFTPGWIDVDESPNGNGSVDIYLSAQNSSELVVFHCVDPTPTLPSVISCTQSTVDKTMSHGHIFDPVMVDNADNVYAAWSNNKDIFYAHSGNKGATWSNPIKVTNAGSGGGMPNLNFFPWITAGDNGRVGIVWYGTDATTNHNDAEWKTYYAFSANARAATPTFRWLVASSQVIHKSNVSQAGLSTDEAVNRNLIDFFQVADDPRDGAAVIAFAGDNNDFDGGTYFTRQIAGPGMRANVPVTVPPNGCPQLTPFQNPEVRDFLGDATGTSDSEFPRPDTDILSIDYKTVRQGGKTYLLADMAVATLLVAPPQASYRMHFAINTVRGLMDSGDEYFVEVTTADGTPQYWLGVTDRNGDGTTTETRAEDIDLDQAADQDPQTSSTQAPFGTGSPGHVRVRVDVSRLDWFFEAGDDGPAVVPPAGNGGAQLPSANELVIGLRGRARVATLLATSVVDDTRGGSCIILGSNTCIPSQGGGDEPDEGDEDQDDDGKDDEDEDDDDDNDGHNDDDDDDDDNDGRHDDDDDDDDNDGRHDVDEEGGIRHDDDDD